MDTGQNHLVIGFTIVQGGDMGRYDSPDSICFDESVLFLLPRSHQLREGGQQALNFTNKIESSQAPVSLIIIHGETHLNSQTAHLDKLAG